MALLKCSRLLWRKQYACVSLLVRQQPRPRLPAWGLRGKAGGDKARTKNKWPPHPTPAKLAVVAIWCKHFFLCEFAMTEERRNGERPSAKGVTKTFAGSEGKNKIKMAVARNKDLKNFSRFVLRHGHATSLLPAKVFGAAFRPRPQKKSAQHTASTLSHAEGWQARAGLCVGRAVGCIRGLAKWVELVHFFSQSFHFTLLITFC